MQEDTQQPQPDDQAPVQDDSQPSEVQQAVNEPEEAPAEETPTQEGEETPEPSGEETPEPKPEGRKGKGKEQRLQDLEAKKGGIERTIAKLKGGEQPDATQRQAQETLAAYEQGQVPQQLSVEEYNHLKAMAEGRATAQQDAEVARLQKTVADLQTKQRVSDFENLAQSASQQYDELNPKSDSYDKELDDQVEGALADALELNPDLNAEQAKKIIDRNMAIAKRAQSRGKEGASATLAKQAGGSALTPEEPKPKKEKPVEEMTSQEMLERGIVQQTN